MKKTKSILTTLIAVMLSVTMLLGVNVISAFAASYNVAGHTSVTDYAMGATDSSVSMLKKVEYGKTYATEFSGATSIVKPDGTTIASGANFKPDQVGAYTVWYGNYSYVVTCFIENEYELRVKHNGADVPTYMATNDSFTVPTASVWVKTKDDDEFVLAKDKLGGTDADWSVSYEVYGPSAFIEKNATDGTVKFTHSGTYTLHYYFKVNGGGKYLYKDYTIKVQDGFTDTGKPVLTVVNMPTAISLGTKVTLPKATVTDDYDENVKVEISVKVYKNATDGYVDVPTVELNDDGYADLDNESNVHWDKPVVFENDYNLSFYPVIAGDYTVTYKAVDDKKNENATNQTYTKITASDKTAPVITELADEVIPTKWATETVTAGENASAAVEQGKLKFPMPKFKDNSGKDNVSIIFEIRDSSNSNVVVRFNDITDIDLTTGKAGAGATYDYVKSTPANGLLQNGEEKLTWVAEGDSSKLENYWLTVDLSKYTVDNETPTGTYTVRYEARDKVPLISYKSYEITVEKTLTDTDAPHAEVKFSDDYILFTEEGDDFTVPSVVVDDDTDTRPTVEYKLFEVIDADFGASVNNISKFVPSNAITVKNGDNAELKLVKNEGGSEYYPVIAVEDGETLTFKGEDGKLGYIVKVTDDAGNSFYLSNVVKADGTKNANGGVLVVNEKALDAVKDADIKFKEAGSITQLTVGERTTVGSFAVKLPKASRKYYGFEISLYTKDSDNKVELYTAGKIKLNTAFVPNVDSDTDYGYLVVEDVEFAAPPAVKSITLCFRLFNAAGESKVVYKTYNVVTDLDVGGTEIEAAIKVGLSGNAYATYQLKNESGKFDNVHPDHQYIIRSVEATGKFSIMGSLFTAYNEGTFTFCEKYIRSTVDGTPTWADATPIDKNNSGKYSVTISDTATPAWQVQGRMPTYSELNQYVKLPLVTASSDYANAKIDIKGTFKAAGNSSVTNLKVADTAANNDENGIMIADQAAVDAGKADFVGQYYFLPTKDGSYEIKYTAYDANKSTINQEFVIKVGDVVPPTFTVEKEHSSRATENSKFKFSPLNITLEQGESLSDFKVTKNLKSPDGTPVYTVSGNASDYAAETELNKDGGYTFTKTGTYVVEYIVTDKAGNDAIKTSTISVSAAKVNNPVSTKIISTVLIIVGVLLIAGVILYFVRFRKVKSK